MRQNGPRSQHRHLLYDKPHPDEESLQVHERWYGHDEISLFDALIERNDASLQPSHDTQIYILLPHPCFNCIGRKRKFLSMLPRVHSDYFAHNVGQRIVLYHAIVYDETVRRGIRWYILLTLEFYSNIHGCALDRFVLSRAIDDHERAVT